ncbi:MAG: protein phosphatase 2C domain-containing protein [Chloroflexales bacterium]|nr:protein phosphatase 2C domain-containing protein [Chloroflexales bacterium]
MLMCPACGSKNRSGARFCWSCAAPLAAVSQSSARPSLDDTLWLAATLADSDSSSSTQQAATGQTAPLKPPELDQEESMDQPQNQAPRLFGGRYELIEVSPDGPVVALDHKPWQRCWACGETGNEAGEAFCINCGAALEQRRYRGMITPAVAPAGLALIPSVIDEDARNILPAIWDKLEDGEHILVLLHDSGRGPVVPPLDETVALRVGRHLVRLLASLNHQGMTIGDLEPEQLEVTAAGEPRLRDASGLNWIEISQRSAVAVADMVKLASLLEALTDTPRTTQRLEEDKALAATMGNYNLTALLRRVRTGSIMSIDEFAGQLEALLIDRTHPIPLRQIPGALSDTGVVRAHNEDSLFTLNMSLSNTSEQRAWGLYMVADGMGGHAAGEIASGLAIRGAAEIVLSEYLSLVIDSNADYDDQQAQAIVHRAVMRANDYILREGQMRDNDMGSTLTMALVVGDRATIANVGDSRTYLYRDGKLKRVTRDHSLVMRLVELGQIEDKDIYTHPQRNAVLRSLGDKPDVQVDIFSTRLYSGDALLLCSDGQWEMTQDPEMERVIAANGDPQRACEAFIRAANQAGGEDNVTSVLVRLLE